MRYVIFAILVTILAVPSSAFAERWELETVDTGFRITRNGISIAVDAKDNPHIFYTVGDELKYGYYDGSEWVFSYIEDGEGYPGHDKSLALDSFDRPHVAYTTEYFEEKLIKYAFLDGSKWCVETLDSDDNVSWNCVSIALDRNDNPVISFRKFYSDSGGVAYAYKEGLGSTWIIEEADSQGGRSISMALDSTGYPHISHCTGPGWDKSVLRYTYKDTSGWHSGIVDGEGDLGFCSTMAIDSAGKPHIAYYKQWPQDETKYAHWDGATWYTEFIDNPEEFIDLSITLDSTDSPHILSSRYCSVSDVNRYYEIVYFKSDYDNWVTITVYDYLYIFDEDDDGGCASCAISLDSSDSPHVAFCRRSVNDTQELIYARWIVAPSEFDLVSPPKFAEVIEPVVFDWEDSTSSAGEVTYDLYCSKDREFEVYRSLLGLTDSTFTPPEGTFEEDVIYFWKVRAFDGFKETWSDVFYFTVNEFGPPKAYALYYPRPNPSRYSAIVRFDIPEKAVVKLVLYDLTGRVISVIADEELTTGVYEREIYGLMPGVYIYKLEADNLAGERYNAARKMVVIR
jgi:hypothetical protein